MSKPTKGKNPPKNRYFLGLVQSDADNYYWDIFFWGTKADGLDKSQFVSSDLFEMPELVRWEELPKIEEYECI